MSFSPPQGPRHISSLTMDKWRMRNHVVKLEAAAGFLRGRPVSLISQAASLETQLAGPGHHGALVKMLDGFE